MGPLSGAPSYVNNGLRLEVSESLD
ncbi:hypothetical protein AERO8C_140129 [Aeromonas veronii]|uniref:Uncharacterized protein n=1 Tax=Aeromonas veronii TaxID=654 RepID=A0A653KU70_AERVE|nr:hypothetical protein AERO8C_140129 [Aeromonas veronii]